MAIVLLLVFVFASWVLYIFFPKSTLNRTLETPLFGPVPDDDDDFPMTIAEHAAQEELEARRK